MPWARRNAEARSNQLGTLAHAHQTPVATPSPPCNFVWVKSRAVIMNRQAQPTIVACQPDNYLGATSIFVRVLQSLLNNSVQHDLGFARQLRQRLGIKRNTRSIGVRIAANIVGQRRRQPMLL